MTFKGRPMDGNGYLWRRVSEELVTEIDSGRLAPGTRLPADFDLAERFGVNRHTVRRALQDLQGRGLLRSERGRGTFVVDDVMRYRLGRHTRFTENLLANRRAPGRALLSIEALAAEPKVAEALALPPGDPVTVVTLLGSADDVPLSLGRNRFPAARLPGLQAALEAGAAAGRVSITAALREIGIPSYGRRWTCVAARMPDPAEARLLRMPLTAPVLETEALDEDEAGTPVNHAHTMFCAMRIQFLVEG
jgi:GntR family phosphonate transport system transcriptional regulator